jgi:hypothetical protein
MELKNLTRAFNMRVAKIRIPRFLDSKCIARCGNNGQFVEKTYPGQQMPWRLYEQFSDVGMAVIIIDGPAARHLALETLWRPTDIDSVELPARVVVREGGPERFVQGIYEEIKRHICDATITAVKMCPGFSQDPTRKLLANGSPACVYPFIIHLRHTHRLQSHPDKPGSNKRLRFFPEPKVKQMVKNGEIADLTTCFLLQAAGIISTEDFSWIEA